MQRNHYYTIFFYEKPTTSQTKSISYAHSVVEGLILKGNHNSSRILKLQAHVVEGLVLKGNHNLPWIIELTLVVVEGLVLKGNHNIL